MRKKKRKESSIPVEDHALNILKIAGLWWRMPLIPALERQKQADLCEFKSSLIYKVSSRTARAVSQRSPVLKNQRQTIYVLQSNSNQIRFWHKIDTKTVGQNR